MEKRELIKKVMEKKELQNLPIEDVEMAFAFCDKKNAGDREKIKCTRALLHKVYGAFGSRKLLILKEHEPEWILRKHVSTRERLPYYRELYERLLREFKGVIFDLGAGVNGFSLPYIGKTRYVAVEGIGQLSELMQDYFKRQRFNARSYHLSLFNLKKLKNLIKKEHGKKIIFLFKVLDSLEALQRGYSKKLLEGVVPLVDKVIVSFATRSLIKRKRFKAKRNWIVDFVKERFKLLDDFELGSERYILFKRK